jgi:hypothetical protein
MHQDSREMDTTVDVYRVARRDSKVECRLVSSLHTDQRERIEARLSRTGGAFLRPVSGNSKLEAAEFHFVVAQAVERG